MVDYGKLSHFMMLKHVSLYKYLCSFGNITCKYECSNIEFPNISVDCLTYGVCEYLSQGYYATTIS